MQIWLNADENASTHTVKKTCAFFSLDDDRIYPSGYTNSIPTRVYVSLFWFSNLAPKKLNVLRECGLQSPVEVPSLRQYHRVQPFELRVRTPDPINDVFSDYAPLNRFVKSILLIFWYKYPKSNSSEEYDPLHKIIITWFYYSI